MNPEQSMLTLSGTYTLDPVANVVDFWIDYLRLDTRTLVTPYAQLFQQLLDPGSALRSNRSGANVVLVRWADVLAHAPGATPESRTWTGIAARVEELASALTSFRHTVPCLVLLGPADHEEAVLDQATTELESRLVGTPNLFVERGARAMTRYRVDDVHDPVSDRFGHVPFSANAIIALGTTVARWYAVLVRPPVKVIAVDGDNTLWSGVVAEDGIDGVRFLESHLALQRALVAQEGAGRLVCLLSKNERDDVQALFEGRAEMPLKWSHLVGHRIDWNPKSDNLRDLLWELELGLDSVVFLDDNPVECAEMRLRCPEVTTVRIPTDASIAAGFADHLWLFDQPRVTVEDRSRAKMYHENASRAELRRSTDSLQSFIDSLELAVDIAPVSQAEVPRVAQLTQRTNQFNASLIRVSEAGVLERLAAPDTFQRFVRARDRFGDYGIVGVMRASAHGGRLEMDLFMLSCRALGRGIEHRMIAAAGAHAMAWGLREVAVLYRRGDRNAPARRALESVFGGTALADEHWFALPAEAAAGIVFEPSAAASEDDSRAANDERQPPTAGARPDLDARFEHIAHTLTTAAAIEQAMACQMRRRPDLATGFVAPRAGMEREIASIWQDALRIDQVGAHDRFQDLGGKSIHLVQVHRLMHDRLRVDLDITELFQHATVASLAAHLTARTHGASTSAAQARGERMREARARAANRVGAEK